MKTTTEYAFGLIDAQRGFMPAEEGQRLNVEGFGELPITEGEQIVSNVNTLLGEFAVRNLALFTTQDWHPENTAHFAEEPNFNTTWPRHCVNNTPGAELHPEIVLPAGSKQFVKGFEPLMRGEDDTSYSGYNAYNQQDGLRPTEYLENHGVTTLILGGLALDYCVGKTAIDMREKAGLEVTVVTDATRPVAEETGVEMLEQFKDKGIKVATTEEVLHYLTAA